MKTRAHVIVSGRVQGVFYRAKARDKAVSAGVSGWVGNLPDGNVEAVFEGGKDKVEEMIEWCKKGPSGARVDDVFVSWEEPEGLEGFDVRR